MGDYTWGEFSALVKGYTKALKDFQYIIDGVDDDLKRSRKHMSKKYVDKTLKAVIENRQKLWEGVDGEGVDGGFFRYNRTTDEVEYFVNNQGDKY